MIMTHENYAEYKRNLYVTGALSCVTNSTGSNVYPDRIPLTAVRERFAYEHVSILPDGYQNASGVWVPVPETSKVVRDSDGRVFGTFGAESAATRRQYSFLTELAAGVTSESPGDLRITAAGTTRNGGRGYLQISSAGLCEVAGMEYAPFYEFGISNDGSLAVVSTTGAQIIICANMVQGILGAAGKNGKGARVKQTSRVTDLSMITRHKIALGLEQQASAFDLGIKELSETVVTDAQWTAFLDEIAPVNVEGASKNAETRNDTARGVLSQLYKHDERAAQWEGSALGVMQAVNVFDLWERGTRGDTDSQTRMTDEFLSGRLGAREIDRADALNRVLVAA